VTANDDDRHANPAAPREPGTIRGATQRGERAEQ